MRSFKNLSDIEMPKKSFVNKRFLKGLQSFKKCSSHSLGLLSTEGHQMVIGPQKTFKKYSCHRSPSNDFLSKNEF